MTIRVEPALTGLIDLLGASTHIFDLRCDEDQGDTGIEDLSITTGFWISG